MRKSILRLYRSAKALRFDGGWLADLSSLPNAGLVLWGAKDPYVDLAFGRSFAEQYRVPFHADAATGHWMIAENPEFAARHLAEFWQKLD